MKGTDRYFLFCKQKTQTICCCSVKVHYGGEFGDDVRPAGLRRELLEVSGDPGGGRVRGVAGVGLGAVSGLGLVQGVGELARHYRRVQHRPVVTQTVGQTRAPVCNKELLIQRTEQLHT